jgi:hypothetical protein
MMVVVVNIDQELHRSDSSTLTYTYPEANITREQMLTFTNVDSENRNG